MHVAIQVTAPAAEAYARVSYALKCLKQQVLSDNRSLEDLHWIANATKYLDGSGGSDPHAPVSRDVRPRPYSPPPPRQSSTRASYPPPPRRTASYDYPEDSYQYSVRLMHYNYDDENWSFHKILVFICSFYSTITHGSQLHRVIHLQNRITAVRHLMMLQDDHRHKVKTREH